jgi:hypothetical protein
MNSYGDIIENVGWKTVLLANVWDVFIQMVVSNIGRSYEYFQDMTGLSPRFINSFDLRYIKMKYGIYVYRLDYLNIYFFFV